MTRPVTKLCDPLTATIDISADDDLSGAVDLLGRIPVAIYMPAAWTAADITFEVSYDGATFVPLHDTSAAVVTVSGPAASQCHALSVDLFLGVQHIKIKSSVAQAADRDIVVMAARPAR